jgi:plastocyanin
MFLTMLLAMGLFFSAIAGPAMAQSSSSSAAGADGNNASVVRIATGASSSTNLQFFVPSQISVKEGATVTWVNEDSAVHTITSGDAKVSAAGDGLFDSSILSPKKEFKHTFETQGTFPYFCSIHPFMTGVVKVAAAAGSEQSSSGTGHGQGQAKEAGNANAAVSSSSNGNNTVGAQASAEAKAKTMYKPSYPKMKADSKSSFTVHSEKHLYKPGEQVTVEGEIWSSLLTQVGGANVVTVQVTDNNGTVVTNQNATVNGQGEYTATFTLPSDAKQGAYTIDSKLQVKANLLGTLSADVTAKIESSAKFVVVSPEGFAVNAEGKAFTVNIASNSTISNFKFDQGGKKVSFVVKGETGTQGVTQITIPKALLSGQMMVIIDGQAFTPDSDSVIVTSDTDSQMTLEINYHHSEHTVEIAGTSVVPEFPISMVVMAVAISSVVAAVTVAGKRGFGGVRIF